MKYSWHDEKGQAQCHILLQPLPTDKACPTQCIFFNSLCSSDGPTGTSRGKIMKSEAKKKYISFSPIWVVKNPTA